MLMIITMIFFQIRFQIITKIQQPLQKGHLFKQWITNFQDLIAIIIIVVIITSSYSNNGDATKRFANAKSISSAQYFGNSNMSEVKFNKLFYLEISKLI